MTPIVANKKGNGFMLESVTDWEFTTRDDKECLRVSLSDGSTVSVYGEYIPYVKYRLGIEEAERSVTAWLVMESVGEDV